MMDANATVAPPGRRDFGHVYQRGRIHWMCYRVGGKTYSEPSQSENRTKAERLLSRRQAELWLGQFTAPDARRTTLADLEQEHRDYYKRKAFRSTERQEDSWQHLRRVLGNARAEALTADRLAEYVRTRSTEGAAPATITVELNALHCAMRLAQDKRKLVGIPKFPQMAPAGVRTDFFEADDLERCSRSCPPVCGRWHGSPT